MRVCFCLYVTIIFKKAEKLLDRGLHPVRIAEGYDRACQIAVDTVAKISDQVNVQKGDVNQSLFNTASTTLSSKIVNVHRDQMARIAVDSVLAVADFDRNDVNFDMIKMEGKPGGQLGEYLVL